MIILLKIHYLEKNLLSKYHSVKFYDKNFQSTSVIFLIIVSNYHSAEFLITSLKVISFKILFCKIWSQNCVVSFRVTITFKPFPGH